MHLAGQLKLLVGVEAQAEEPVGRQAGALEVAGALGQAQGRFLAPLHDLRVQRRERIKQGGRILVIAVQFAKGRHSQNSSKFLSQLRNARPVGNDTCFSFRLPVAEALWF